MTVDKIGETIFRLFTEKEALKNLAEDEDFFERGVSSLTIVELQISIEEALKFQAPTHELMRSSTIREWISIYVQRAKDSELIGTDTAF